MTIERREFLTSGIAAGAVGLAASTSLRANQGAIDPRSYGARGDGITDDTEAVKQALSLAFDRNLPVDGGDSQFAVHGNMTVSGRTGPWIRSLRLRQLSPADDRKSLHFYQCQRIRIDRLQIDLGSAKSTGYFNESGGLWIDGGDNHVVRNVEAFGHGKNSLITIWNTARSKYANLHAHDAEYDAHDAVDDVMQGIFLCRNKDCSLELPIVSDLTGNASTRFPNRFTRGIVACGNTGLNIVGARVSNVEQGIDVTGSEGNLSCLIVGAHCYQCSAVGVKLANSAVGCIVRDSVAERCGLMGFFASGPAEAGLRYKTQNCDFIRCTSYDAGYNGFSDSGPHAGFRIEKNRFDVEYPMGIRFIQCRATDRQAHRTMEYGFYEDVQLSAPSPNQMIDCVSTGHVRAMIGGSWAYRPS